MMFTHPSFQKTNDTIHRGIGKAYFSYYLRTSTKGSYPLAGNPIRFLKW